MQVRGEACLRAEAPWRASVKGEAQQPELSVIIPTLNEVATLPLLCADLAAQQGVAFEVLVSDGGSTDGTCKLATELLAYHRLAGTVLSGPAGRGRQLNHGAARARGERLLFLHADSRLPAPTALADALDTLRRERNPCLAGHFALRFDLPDTDRDFGYYLAEVKARLGLPGTIHGDQGFLLSAAFFNQLGGFREDLPVLEDTLLAETLRARGKWLLLPGALVTSPRRFQAEGFHKRQTLNALLMNFVMIGWDEPLRRIPALYRPQNCTRPLDLTPCLRMIDDLLAGLPRRERWRIWLHTGAFVRGNAWQLALRRQARRAFVADHPPEAVPLGPVLRFRHRCDALTDHPPGRLLAALLTWLWYRTRCRGDVL
jgi:rSAM/selenodomain-associated transferase 2